MSQVLRLRLGDCMDVLRGIADDTIGAVVSDPPYGLDQCLEFMKEDWDSPWKYGFADMDFKGFRTLPSFSS